MPLVRGIVNPEVIQVPEYPLKDEILKQKALTFLMENKSRSYRQMRKDGVLQGYLDMKVEACKETAQGLIESGVFENQAWNRAIRQELLESETD